MAKVLVCLDLLSPNGFVERTPPPNLPLLSTFSAYSSALSNTKKHLSLRRFRRSVFESYILLERLLQVVVVSS